MLGQITSFSEGVGYGVIKAEDGSKYRFAKRDVLNLDDRLIGHSVDFVVSARRPKDIIVMAGTAWSVFANAGA